MSRAIKTFVVSFSKKPSEFLTEDAYQSANRNNPTASQESGAARGDHARIGVSISFVAKESCDVQEPPRGNWRARVDVRTRKR